MKKWHLRVELSFNKFGDGEHGYGDGNGRGFATVAGVTCIRHLVPASPLSTRSHEEEVESVSVRPLP